LEGVQVEQRHILTDEDLKGEAIELFVDGVTCRIERALEEEPSIVVSVSRHARAALGATHHSNANFLLDHSSVISSFQYALIFA
jgi:hypothetical protein